MPITGTTVQHGEEWVFPCPLAYRISRHCAKTFPYVKENSVLSHPSFSCTQLDSPVLSNSLWILDTIKSSLLHSEFKTSIFICLFFFWAQELVDRKQEKVKNWLFDLDLASSSFIWWSLNLVLEKSVNNQSLCMALKIFQTLLYLPSAVSFSSWRILYCY